MALSATACTGRTPEQFVERGNGYLAKKQYAEATIEFRNAVQRAPTFGEAHLRLADTLLERREMEGAAVSYIQASELLPNNVQAQLRAGEMLFLGGFYAEAQVCARRALRLDPKNVRAQVLNANTLSRQKKNDAALAAIQKAIELDPTRAASYQDLGAFQLSTSTPEAAEVTFRRAIEVNPKAADPHVMLASLYWAQGRTADAESELNAALALQPSHLGANRALATLYIGTGRAARAESHLRAAVEGVGTSDARLMLADYYVTINRQADATRLLEQIATSPDGYGEARSRLATLAYEAGRTAEGHALIDATLLEQPANVRALLTKAQFLLRDRKIDAAFERVGIALRGDPRSVPAHYMLASIYAQRGDPESAAKEYENILQLDPSSVAARFELARLHLARGDSASAGNLAEAVVGERPRSVEAQMLQIRTLLASGGLDRATPMMERLLSQAGTRAEVQWLAGMVWLARRDRDKARTCFERALALRPDALEPLDALIALDLTSGHQARARAALEAQILKRPNSSGLLILAGRVYDAVGDKAKAEQALLKAVAVDPQNPDGYENLVRLYATQGRVDRALSEMDALARKNPSAVGPATMMGTILQATGKLAEAQGWYEKALAIDPHAVVAANNLAWLYAEQGGDLDAALKFALVAREQLPTQPGVNDTLGWIYYKRGEFGNAVAPLKVCVEREPANPVCRFHLGLAYARTGNNELARDALQLAIKLNANFSGAATARSVLASLR